MSFTYRNPHEQSLAIAQTELVRLEEEEQEVNERLAWIGQRKNDLENHIRALKPLIENDPNQTLAETGLTNICRELLMQTSKWITASEMRSLLSAIGVDLKPYTNPMAVLHSVLGRLGQKQRSSNGTTYYAPPGIPPFTESVPGPNSLATMLGPASDPDAEEAPQVPPEGTGRKKR